LWSLSPRRETFSNGIPDEMWTEGIRAYFKGEVVVSKDLMAL